MDRSTEIEQIIQEIGPLDDEPYEDEEEEDYEPDPDVAFRKSILNEIMERHPDMALTGDSVQDYIYNGGDLESAGIDDPMAGEY